MCLAVGLLLIAAPVGALVPDDISVVTNSEWLTAGSGETTTVTIHVNSSGLASGAFVDLTVDSKYGSISPGRVELDSAGRAAATFRPGTVAGTATITANVSCEGLDEPLVRSIEQKIDHAAPYRVSNKWYSPRITAGKETDITVRMVDRYGNVVDNWNVPETVKFMVGSPGGGAIFDGCSDIASVQVDQHGNATVTLKVDTVAGENIIYIQPPKPIAGQYISIRGTADGVPGAIDCELSAASVPANEKDKITLMYTLTDAYGNPAGGQGVWVNSSGLYCQEVLIYSSSWGEVWVTYGPESSIGIVDITATAVENPDVAITERVEFTSTDPVKMVLTASPQSMPSGDLKDGTIVSELRAKVMDIKGNPVEGEMVTFTIETNSIDLGGSNSTGSPYLSGTQGLNETTATDETTATTDGDGYARVKFHPGKFAKPEKGDKATAKGTVVVRATWKSETPCNSDTDNITLTWMNYPYLSVETEVSNTKIAVNSTDEHVTNMTDVTIRLKGDGYAMEPDPVDVVLVIDTSGSMNKTDVEPSRMEAAQTAAKDFVDQMDLGQGGRDRVALISFAFDAKLKQNLTQDSGKIENAIDSLSADGATNMRLAYYTAIKHLKDKGRPEAIKAVVLMGDGDWNYHGSPLAKGTGYPDNDSHLSTRYPQYNTAILSGYPWDGSSYDFKNEKYEWYSGLDSPKGSLSRKTSSWYRYSPYYKEYSGKICNNGQSTNQNMSIYASSEDDTEKVRIYTIGFASELNSNVEGDLSILSEATGGRYVWVEDAENLTKVYTDIAGELKTEAGVDTSMTVFENVEIGGISVSASDVFDYKYKYNESTTIESWIVGKDGHREKTVVDRYTRDDTQNWTTPTSKLHFDIGTIHFNQTWETTFRIAVSPSYEPGDDNNINIFDPGAIISFNDGVEGLELPDTYITIFPDLTSTGATTSSLAVEFTEPPPDSGPYTSLIPLNWTTTYKGSGSVSISLAYSRHEDMRSSTTLLRKTLPASEFMNAGNTTTDSTMMAVNDLPEGQYWITVTASARDAKTDEDIVNVWAHTRDGQQAYIKIG